MEARYHKSLYPAEGDFVIVRVMKVEPAMGAYVSLLEYGGVEGLILPTELSKRRFRSIQKVIRVGRQEVVQVVRVDSEKGFIDLSKKRVSPEEIAEAELKFSKSKKVALTVRQVANRLNMTAEEVYTQCVWPLEDSFGHAYDALAISVNEGAAGFARVFGDIKCSDELKEVMCEEIKPRLTAVQTKLRARINVSCIGIDGINAVKASLISALEKFQPKTEGDETSNIFNFDISLVASPLFTVNALTILDKAAALEKMNEVLNHIETTILSYPGGDYALQGEVAVSGTVKDKEEGDSDSDSGSESDSDSEYDSEEESEEASDEE